MRPTRSVPGAMPICRRLLVHALRREASRTAWIAGSNMATSNPMIPMTTSNSTRVKPRERLGMVAVFQVDGNPAGSVTRPTVTRNPDCAQVRMRLRQTEMASRAGGALACTTPKHGREFRDMERLSSNNTFFYKWIFPIVWFGGLAVALAFVVWQAFVQPGGELWFAFVVLLFMAVGGFLIMKLIVFDLVDEVWDGGWELVVRNRGREVRIPLAEIINVNYDRFSNPPRVTLMLRDPCEFGCEIAFMVPQQMLRAGESGTAHRAGLDRANRCGPTGPAKRAGPGSCEGTRGSGIRRSAAHQLNLAVVSCPVASVGC